jgi:Xaa-Pro dipeptidase
MSENHARMQVFVERLKHEQIDVAFIADADSIFYFSGVWGYLGMEFGRATLLALATGESPTLITPAMEAEMARAMSGLGTIKEWSDGEGGEWPAHIQSLVKKLKPRRIGIEKHKTHPRVLEAISEAAPQVEIVDVAAIVDDQRMIKSAEEIAAMRQAGQVAVAMVEGARAALKEGVPEYEVALAIVAAGTRRAAEFLAAEKQPTLFSPTIHNLGIMQSGRDMCMVHRRSTIKRVAAGDPVYLCFCGLVTFKQFKLGFDRQFFIKTVDAEMARAYETAIKAQMAALSLVRAGAIAEDIALAAEDVYLAGGFGPAYRTGRGVGCSFLEEPQLKKGNKTRLQARMTIVVDGGVTIPGRGGGRVGDSLVVTETGYEFLTNYPRELTIL